jgi:hypothetical protein
MVLHGEAFHMDSAKLTDVRKMTTHAAGNTPSIAADTNAGNTATVSILSGSTDLAGQISVTPNGTGIAAGAQVTVTFLSAFTAWSIVSFSPNNANAATAGCYGSSTLTTFTLNASTALSAGQTYTFTYWTNGR